MPLLASPTDGPEPSPLAATYKLKLSHIFIYTFAVAVVYAVQTAIAFSLYPKSYQQFVSTLTPQIAVLAIVDAMAKGLTLCGLVVFASRGLRPMEGRIHPAEYLWPLLGCDVLLTIISPLFAYAWSGGVYLIGGGILTWLIPGTRWKSFYLLVTLSPFLIGSSLLYLLPPQTWGNFAFAFKEMLISATLLACMVGTNPTMAAWGTLVSQLGLTSVSTYIFLLVFLNLWQ